MNFEGFKDKDSLLNIIYQFKTLDDVKNTCKLTPEISKLCFKNKNNIAYIILKKYFDIVPFKNDRVLLALRQFGKINKDYNVDLAKSEYYYYESALNKFNLDFYINNEYFELLEVSMVNKKIHFSIYWSYITSRNAQVNILQKIDNYNNFYINTVINKNFYHSIKNPDIKAYYIKNVSY